MSRPDYHQHFSHEERNAFGRSFGQTFGAGLAQKFLGCIGCGGTLLVIALVVGGGWYFVKNHVKLEPVVRKKADDPTPTGTRVLAANPPPRDADTPSTGGRQAQPGTLVVRSGTAMQAGVTAFVEVDGKPAIDWPTGANEVKLSLAPGSYEVAVRSKTRVQARYLYFAKDFGTVDVAGGRDKVLAFTTIDPDPRGKW